MDRLMAIEAFKKLGEELEPRGQVRIMSLINHSQRLGLSSME